MPPAMDHVADVNHQEFARLSKLYEFPEFLKKADFPKLFAPREGMAVTLYADPVRRQFPCDTAASTFVSAMFFAEKRAEFDPKTAARIDERLDYYVGYWKVKQAVDVMKAKRAEYVKQADAVLPDSSYAYVAVRPDTGLKDRRCPMRNAAEVKAAADHLLTYRERYPYARRHEMAKRILEKAASFGASIAPQREFLERQAGMGVCDPKKVVAMLEDRARLAPMPAFKTEITKLAVSIAKQPAQALHEAVLVDLVKTAEQIDRSLGLIGKYTDKIPWPEDVIFEATYSKAAEAIETVCPLTTGKIYAKSDFSRLKLADVRSLLGDDLADEVRSGFNGIDPEKMAEVAATLPRPDAVLLDSLMADANVRPQMSKAASIKRSKADWAKLAAGHK